MSASVNEIEIWQEWVTFLLLRNKMSEKTDLKNIPQVYAGKTVFITGGNGFLGKVLLEKLLRSCPDIKEVIVLLNGASQKEIFEKKRDQLMQSSVFDRLKQEAPRALVKIIFVAGDVTAENLGLEKKMLEFIQEEVSFVFHCAANVRFEEPPRTLMKINVLGVYRVAQVCLKMTKLQALVHVSTAYSFCHKPLITEDMYCEKIPIHIMLDFDAMSDERIEHICDSYRKSRPSNYQYSKALGETLLVQGFSNRIPVIIVRPGIITAAAKEPFPGWIDNYNGPNGFIALSCKGVLKSLLVKRGVCADWVPVDLVANTLIAAAHFLIVNKNPAKLFYKDMRKLNPTHCDVPIINCVCPDNHQLSWNEVTKICMPLLLKYPSERLFSPPGGIVTSNEIIHGLCKLFLHYLPASTIDAFTLLTIGRAKMVNTYKRIHGVMNHLQLYTTRQFFFTSKNLSTMIAYQLPEDAETFPIDQSKFKWSEYLENYVHGVRLYFLKEDDDTLSSARKRLFRLQASIMCGKILCVGLLLFLMMRKFKPNTGIRLLTDLKIPNFLSFEKLRI
ncbi:putative fatty acyl-CoA reductase CG5065 [Trichonephila inaurata madagascariensis]|uniref:Fatty acyl-CoA reductase n=1 Tax=Trichonephila inaurata madagascariensis TaxID=2747483 RepID=A0A8X6YLE1_9ARAC|nr:putative fatty acyl-CoA reductase CG5065 [Trichonephila inaurata madagascariensis]